MKRDIIEDRRRAMREEEAGQPERCMWMSFCDGEKPKGQQFVGVVITLAPGLIHAVEKTWRLGINPGGEVAATEIDAVNILPEHFDRLLSKAELVSAGYCDEVPT